LKARFLIARLAQIEDIDRRIVAHRAAILANVGLAIAIHIMAHGDPVSARGWHRHAKRHRTSAGGRFNAVEPFALFKPFRLGAAIALHTQSAR